MPKKGEYAKKWRKDNVAIYESILVSENTGKWNPEESYKNKHQKHIACSCGYKLVSVDDKFSKPFKTYLDKDAVYNFINNMTEESKYCKEVMEKHFSKKPMMTLIKRF